MWRLSTSCWIFGLAVSALLVGCSTTTVIPADKQVKFLDVGESYVAPDGGMWLVPPARMQDILRKLAE